MSAVNFKVLSVLQVYGFIASLRNESNEMNLKIWVVAGHSELRLPFNYRIVLLNFLD